MFKHALTHDVAYHSLLLQRRKELHHLVGLAIEELYADRLAEQYELLGYHFGRAGDWPRALRYRLKAAEKAAQAFATREAVALYDQALEAADQLGDDVARGTRMAVHQAKAVLYLYLSDWARAQEENEAFLTVARQLGDREQEGVALAASAWALMRGHDFEGGLARAGEALAIADEVGAAPVRAAALSVSAFIAMARGRLEEAEAQATQVVALTRAARRAVSQRMRAYWVKRRAELAKGKSKRAA